MLAVGSSCAAMCTAFYYSVFCSVSVHSCEMETVGVGVGWGGGVGGLRTAWRAWQSSI